MTEPTPLFKLDENTFILNGRERPALTLTSPPAAQSEAVRPEKLPGASLGQYRRRLWVGLGIWAFIIMAATAAIPIGLGTIGIAIKAKPTRAIATLDMALASPPLPVASTPAAPARSPNIIDEPNRFTNAVTPPAAPPPNILDDLRRFANTVRLPPATPRHHEITRSRAERIIPHHFVASKSAELQLPPAAPIGCPPSVCFPPQPGQTNRSGQRPSAVDLDEAGQPVTTWSRR